MINTILVFLFLIFQSESDSLISKMQNKFESINNLQADFVQSSNGQNIMQGNFYFSKDENYRIELKNNTIISDGKSIWNIDNKRSKVIISNIDEDPLAFSLKEYIYDYPEKCKVTEEKMDKNNSLLILDANQANLNFKTAKLFVNNEFIITKILFEDFTSNQFEFKFTNINLNTNLSPKLFTFQNDKEYKIIDLR
ncbi:MAG: outer membrane lipoprotein carrier protein LolA [Ignavibacteriales bacterium]|nr:outer membrane lipoprotein carrier protein LolA [Ignavibacteriales bacterium]